MLDGSSTRGQQICNNVPDNLVSAVLKILTPEANGNQPNQDMRQLLSHRIFLLDAVTFACMP